MTSLWVWLGLTLVWLAAVAAVLAVGDEVRAVRRNRR